MDGNLLSRNLNFAKIIPRMELFIQKLVEKGFRKQHSPTNTNIMPISSKDRGWELIVDNILFSFTMRDCSFLHLNPKIIAQPRTTTQLQIIVKNAHELQIPLTFASGKTGLSGGFANPFMLVDLEYLSTLAKPYTFDEKNAMILADQSVLISELIRVVQIRMNNKYIFPCQPSSAFKLPVRLGGLISTNASGITSGKLGPIENWVERMLVILPTGEIRELKRNTEIGNHEPAKQSQSQSQFNLFDQIIGGMGLYGVVLNAQIQLAPIPNPKEMKYYALFGSDFSFIFDALQQIQNKQIFPLNCEFVSATTSIPGLFQNLSPSETVRWIILIKDTHVVTDEFLNTVKNYGKCGIQSLSSSEYQLYLEERTGLAIQTKSTDPEQEFLRFPGFEDLLMAPEKLKAVFDEINYQFKQFRFPPLIVAYGHLNFRRGQGSLLHIRIPVNVSKLANDPLKIYHQIARIIAKMNFLLEQKYQIRPKAEHSTGMFTFWHARQNLPYFLSLLQEGKMVYSPHLFLFLQLCSQMGINRNDPFPNAKAEELLVKLTFMYLANKDKFSSNYLLGK
ncbi:MAG: hypothetical protein DRO88_07895 [Promethearchaeia archaeon]|nr:MAG: hypothetical protein DRO88_07895 [Candidatus Lokiarchaeia archaeon]